MRPSGGAEGSPVKLERYLALGAVGLECPLWVIRGRVRFAPIADIHEPSAGLHGPMALSSLDCCRHVAGTWKGTDGDSAGTVGKCNSSRPLSSE